MSENPKLSDLALELLDDGAVILDGFNDRVIGVGSVFPHTTKVLIYDVGLMLDSMVEKDGMSYEVAQEHYSFNIEGAYIGDGTPIFMSDRISKGDLAN